MTDDENEKEQKTPPTQQGTRLADVMAETESEALRIKTEQEEKIKQQQRRIEASDGPSKAHMTQIMRRPKRGPFPAVQRLLSLLLLFGLIVNLNTYVSQSGATIIPDIATGSLPTTFSEFEPSVSSVAPSVEEKPVENETPTQWKLVTTLEGYEVLGQMRIEDAPESLRFSVTRIGDRSAGSTYQLTSIEVLTTQFFRLHETVYEGRGKAVAKIEGDEGEVKQYGDFTLFIRLKEDRALSDGWFRFSKGSTTSSTDLFELNKRGELYDIVLAKPFTLTPIGGSEG